MNLIDLQARLTAAGHPCAGEPDLGPVTYAALMDFAARRPLGPLGQALGLAAAGHFPAYDIVTDLRRIHWIAQAAHETGGFRDLTELGGEAYFVQYDGRPELGNVQPGDGFRFRGRGLFQITGRFNYRHFGQAIGEPLEDNPGLAAQPGVAVRLACQFWVERRIAQPADADDCAGVTRRINGGLNGLADRQAATDRLKAIFGLSA
jgi:putative chitinase